MLSPTPPINRPSLHPGTGYLIGPRVPHGLAAVVEGLTREVLRHRPEDIYVFAARHFEKLLKLREQYHAEKYSNIREFDDEFSREFNLWPTKEPRDTGVSPVSGWSLDKEAKILERRGKAPTDMEESPEDVSTDREKRKVSKQTSTKSSSSMKRASRRSTKDKDATADPRATKIIPQMSALRGSNGTILTKDIKQELRKNKLNSGEKGKLSDNVEKGMRGERRSRAKVPKTDKNAEEEIERAMATAGRTSTRRPLKKVRRIETESETETEHEIAARDRSENGYEFLKGDSASREATVGRTRSKDRRPEVAAWLSEHSSERKVSSRALSMDRIRAYVLRKFASTASLEVLRSPTYVEQVQEVIDRAAPIIKEKLEEMRRPRGKRSRSVDFAWHEESFSRHVAKDGKRSSAEEDKGRRQETERRRSGNVERESNGERRDEKLEDQPTRWGEVIPNVENEEKRPGRRGSGRRARRRESGDFGLTDRADDDMEHGNKSECESGAGRDTLEARLTATQSILEGISMSASELSGARKGDHPGGDERGELAASSEVLDHVNVVSLPIVRPPSSRSSRNAAKNGSDSLTLPPISPEAPKSTKKKDEISLPILSAASNGNHSVKRSQEQDDSKDAEEASTMRDITSDMEDMAVLPKDEKDEHAIATETKQDLSSDQCQSLILDAAPADGEEGEQDEDTEEAGWKETPREPGERRASDVSLGRDLEEYQGSMEPEEKREEEIYKDSLNVTPEVADVSPRPDSLEPDESEREKLQDDDANGNDTFDDLKDRLIEIEMAERNIEKALRGQQTYTACNSEAGSEVAKSTSVEKIDEARKSTGEAEETASEVKEKSSSEDETPNEEGKSMSKEEKEEEVKSRNEVEKGSNNTERSMEEKGISNEEGKSMSKEEKEEEMKSRNEVEKGSNKRSIEEKEIPNEERKSMNKEEAEKELTDEVEKASNNTERSTNETGNSMEASVNNVKVSTSEKKGSKNDMEMSNGAVQVITNQAEPSIVENEGLIEEKESQDQVDAATNETKELPNGVEELMVKRHVNKLGSMNTQSQHKDDQIVEVSACETGDDATASNSETVTEKIHDTGTSGNLSEDKPLKASLPTNGNDIGETKTRKKRGVNELPTTTSLSLKIPFSYVLSEGSPCEIPDSVTTVIIPDRPCPSPATSEIEDHQFGSTYLPANKEIIKESTIYENVTEDDVSPKNETRKDEDGAEYGMEAFGEYVRPEVTTLPVDIDFVPDARDAKLDQDIMILHQDLDRIKEEGEEDEENKEDDEGEEEEGHLEKKDDGLAVADAEGSSTAKLEDIVEHEENETDTKVVPESITDEGLASSRVPECEALPEATESTDLANRDKRDVAVESRSTLDNSSEENGSSQDIRTTVSSDAKESTASNRSVESSSVGRPIVPELNLDSLQDNTVSSFKMTANGTATKDSNGSPRESDDATMSLIEPLTPDERLTMGNRHVSADREEETPVSEELAVNSPNFQLQSEVPEEDQLYRAEHAEYELLEKDLLSAEAVFEDETRPPEEAIDSQTLSGDAVRVDLTAREKEESKELDSEKEIARELIGLLDKEAQLRAEEADPERRSEDHGELAGSNLDVNDGSSQPLPDSVRSVSVDEAGKERGNVLSERFEVFDEEGVAGSEAVSELADHVAGNSQEDEARNNTITNRETEELGLEVGEKEHAETSQVANLAELERDVSPAEENKITNQETEEPKLEVEEEGNTDSSQLAPLAEFERDEFSEENRRHEMPDGKITAESECDVINANLADNREGPEGEQINTEDVPKSQSNEGVSEMEVFHEKQQQENKREKREDRGEEEREDVEVQEEESQQKGLSCQEKYEQNKTKAHEENQQEHSEVQEATKSKKGSLTESIEKNEDSGHDESTLTESVIPDKIIADDQTVATSEGEGNIDDLAAKLESVHGPITSAISEQSTKDYLHGRYWTMGTKSSTAETVIAAFGLDTSTDEKIEVLDDAPKSVEDESIMREKDDFYLAVIKIQACIRGFLARHRLRKDLCVDSVSNNIPLTQETAINERLIVPEDHSILREARSGRHRLRREEALRKTTLSLENAFATSRLQHTGEFHDSVPLPLFEMSHSETNSLNESLDKETDEEETKTDTAKSTTCETEECDCHNDEQPGSSQKSNAFANHSNLPIVMHLLADASRNCHFRINQNSDSNLNLSAGGAKLVEPTLDILMLGYPRDDATLENRYLNFITSVEDVGANMDFLSPDIATKSAHNVGDAQPPMTFSEASVPESLREPLALPGTPEGVVIEELVSLDEQMTEDVSSAKSESTKPSGATKTSLDTSSSVPQAECAAEEGEKSHSESSPRTNLADKDDTIGDEGNTSEGVARESEETSANFQNDEEADLHGEDASEKSNAISRNEHADEREDGKT